MMSSRKTIKSVEISDFRGLQGKRVLEFDGADIVIFLGLNGFGKTSIFDSIEWCLTGSLGRYQRYSEMGRKLDFRKEKEVLRCKYVTDPDTYVKVELESGNHFGRKVSLGQGDTDYNMGSEISGYDFGVGKISKKDVSRELINGYFSATHILSQETINHFVTSKKPEERYQALSVNFGTSMYAHIDGNIQSVLREISEKDKRLTSDIKLATGMLESILNQTGSKYRLTTSKRLFISIIFNQVIFF